MTGSIGTEPEPRVAASEPGDERILARQRVQARRDFVSDVVAYVTVNAFLVGVWAITGAGYFWPVWIMGAWGIGVVMHFWDAFLRRPVTEADVDAEVRRLHDATTKGAASRT